MQQISLVVGQAGTGKTTWLIEKAKECAPPLLKAEHQRLLAITRMHGARRRVEMKLRESCPAIRCSVATIDGFALSILNRWRTALGYARPIQAVERDVDFADTIFGIEADFTRVVTAATTLLHSATVRSIIGETYPLILIDEFQDCHGPLLEFVKALAQCSSMLLAADDFQSLNTTVAGCPAVEWVHGLQNNGAAEITELTTCHRTSEQAVLSAARCLRDNVRSSKQTIPVFCCPNAGPVAWKIIDAMVLHFYSAPWNGTTALICPSHDPFLYNVLDSCTNQLQKKNRAPIRWHEERTTEEEKKQIRTNLGLSKTNNVNSNHWMSPSATLTTIETHVATRAQRFARLRGLQSIPREVVERHVDIVVHEKRAYCAHCPSKIVTTVHGAKNREFNNVFILWTYKLPPDQNQQKRLLYNAVTRSKRNCMLLVLGGMKRVQNDPVLSLLGPAQPAIAQKRKTKTRRARKIKNR